MTIGVIGLGHIGLTNLAGFSNYHQVIGYDIDKEKVARFSVGDFSGVEKGIADVLSKQLESIVWTNDLADVVNQSDAVVLCVGTPYAVGEKVDLSPIVNVTNEIAQQAKEKKRLTIIYRSTLPPGTFENQLIPALLVDLGKSLGSTILLGLVPEFLREGSSYEDFIEPEFTLIGQYDEESGKAIEEVFACLNAPTKKVSLTTAELVKHINNVFHALKIDFGNEVGRLSKSLGVDGKEVMELLCLDKRLNISPKYLIPGEPFGGSCLEKDVQSIIHYNSTKKLDLPIINSLVKSNDRYLDNVINQISKDTTDSLGVIGLTFKKNTFDCRLSAAVKIVQPIIEKGATLVCYDQDIAISGLDHITHDQISRELFARKNMVFVKSVNEVLDQSDNILITQPDNKIENLLTQGQVKKIYDLTGRYARVAANNGCEYFSYL